MTYRNLQVRISSDLDKAIGRLSKGSTRSEFVRKVLEDIVRKVEIKKMEDQWIAALKKNPPTKKEIEEDREWLKAQAWEDA